MRARILARLRWPTGRAIKLRMHPRAYAVSRVHTDPAQTVPLSSRPQALGGDLGRNAEAEGPVSGSKS